MGEKKSIQYAVVDAFAAEPFSGNPAVVCYLKDGDDDERWMQTVASEFNLHVELSSGKDVVDLLPNMDGIRNCTAGRGVIVTAPAPVGSAYDIFSRFFCPKFGVNGVMQLSFSQKLNT